MKAYPHNDDGYAVITAFLATLVVLAASLAAISLAMHNTDASAYDRDRVRAVHAAEAGMNDAMAQITSSGAGAPCQITGATTTSLSSTYVADVVYYNGPSIETGTPIACTDNRLPTTEVPEWAVIYSVGTAHNVNRRMQTAARLTPTYGGGFDKAIFSDGTLSTDNNVTIEGDVYTNESWTCPNSLVITGSFYGQGSANLSNSCSVLKDLHVAESITLNNKAEVGRDAIAATSEIWMNHPDTRIGEDARATNITCHNGCVLPRVDPARITYGTSDPPPLEPTLPKLYFDASDWTGYEIFTFSTRTHADPCAAAKTQVLAFDDGDPNNTSPWLIRIESACQLNFAQNNSLVLPDNLAIVTDGGLSFTNHSVWTTPDARTRDLFLIVPYDAPARHNSTCDSRQHDILKENNFDFDHLHFFVYTPCRATFGNNNESSAGQVYAGEVKLNNHFNLRFAPMIVPGVNTTTIAGFSSQVAYIREINL